MTESEKAINICKTIDFDRANTTVCNFTERALTDLDGKIQRLIFTFVASSSNPADVPFMPRSPLKYTNLMALFFVKIQTISLPSDFFSMLHQLQNLTLYKVTLNGMPPVMPPSVSFLQIDSIISEKPLNMSKLCNLAYLQYSNCQLTEFPSLASTAPIKSLDLSYNLLTSLTLLDIAQYCDLKVIDLSNTRIQNGSKEAYCELAAWFKTYHITYNLKIINSTVFSTKVCPETTPLNAEAEAKFNKCYFSEAWWIYLLIIVAAVIILGLLIGFGVTIFFRRRRNTDLWSNSTTTDNDLDTEINEETQADTET